MTFVHAICWVLLYVMVLPFMLACGLTYLGQVTRHHYRQRRTDRGEANFATVLCVLIAAIAACDIANTIWGHR